MLVFFGKEKKRKKKIMTFVKIFLKKKKIHTNLFTPLLSKLQQNQHIRHPSEFQIRNCLQVNGICQRLFQNEKPKSPSTKH